MDCQEGKKKEKKPDCHNISSVNPTTTDLATFDSASKNNV